MTLSSRSLVKDFHVLYLAAAQATVRIETLADAKATRDVLRAQLTRLRPAFETCEFERRSLRIRSSAAPGHTLCDYERCDGEPTVTLPRGSVMCPQHAAVTLLAGMRVEEARSAFRSARPISGALDGMPEPLGRTRELLREFGAQWNQTEDAAGTREYVGGRFDLLRELLAAFEEEDANG